MKTVIKIDKLCKSFGDVKAVNNLSFEVHEKEFLSFLGVNGAGKSTTINILCGQLKKDSGIVIIDGDTIENNLDIIHSKIGIVFQNSVLDKPLSVYDNLQSRAALYN
ncbi:MAG: ATP-binding cassette domain-containing protein, partial [Clostridia bacterium]|nr:ATP-binding cassette domain-containing protein [Clostridia bacterium]